jgi:hypothetical protein
MKLVFAVLLIKLIAEMAGKKTGVKKKEVNKAQGDKAQHPAEYALR